MPARPGRPDDPRNLPDDDRGIGRRTVALPDLDRQLVTHLPNRHPDLALAVPVDTEPQPHHPVEGVLLAVPETHQGHLAQVVRSTQRHLDRRHVPIAVAGLILPRDLGSSGAFPLTVSAGLLGAGALGVTAVLGTSLGIVPGAAAGHLSPLDQVPTRRWGWS